MTAAVRRISIQTGTFVSAFPIITSLALASVASIIVRYVSSDNLYDSSLIYSGIFDLLSIFTGFLATFYVFIVTKGNVFLEQIRTTDTYRMVLKLLKFTILWSAGMIVFSYVLMIANPRDFDLFSANHFLVFFWLANVFLIAVNFTRCVVHFLTIVEADV